MMTMEKEWKLADYLDVIWRKKWLILGLSILGLLAAVVITYAVEPVFEISAEIQPGKSVTINEIGFIQGCV